jgi:Putative zinc-finger
MASYESATTRLVQQELGACALIQDLLPLYMEDEVSPGSRELIAEHLARCERCEGFLAGARSMHAQLRREGTLRASTAARDQATHQAVELGRRRLRWLVVGGICTLFGFGLIMTMVFFLLGKPGEYATARPAPVRVIEDIPPVEQPPPGMMFGPPAPDAPMPPMNQAQSWPTVPTVVKPTVTAVPTPAP